MMFDKYQNDIKDITRDMSLSVFEFARDMSLRNNDSILVETTDDSNKAKNIFAKIGDAVINIINKIKEMFAKFIEKITGDRREKAINAEVEKANAILKNNPKLRDEVVSRLENGELNIPDMAKAYGDVDKIMQHIKNEEELAKANTINGKLNKVADKINDNGAVKIIAAASGAVLTITGLLTIVPKVMNSLSDSKEAYKQITKRGQKCKSEIEKNDKEFQRLSEKRVMMNFKDQEPSISANSFSLERAEENLRDAKREASAFSILASKFGSDLKNVVGGYSKVRNLLKSFNNKHAKL